ncbi:MAG: hypothetical protein ACKV19_16785 [Verrucomicrobiales bacterium]
MNSDFKDALSALIDAEVRFLVVGGYAVIHYAEPRFTKDLDLWIEPSATNASALAKAFRRFGLPLIEVTEADFARPGTQFMVGVPPTSIDFITTCANLDFAPCWERRVMVDIGGLSVPYLSESDLILGKEQLGRDQDLIDVRKLREQKRNTSDGNLP